MIKAAISTAVFLALAVPGRAEPPTALEFLKSLSPVPAAAPAPVAAPVFRAAAGKTVWTAAEAKESFENGQPIDPDKLPGDWKRIAVVEESDPQRGIIDLDGLDTNGEGGKLTFSQKKNPLQESYTYVLVHRETGAEPVYCKRGPASLWFMSKEQKDPATGRRSDARSYTCRMIKADNLLCMKIFETKSAYVLEYDAYAKTAAPAVKESDALDDTRRAHITTWSTLLALGQIHEVFCDAGKIKIAMFTVFFQKRLAPASKSLADQIDGVFVNVRGAKRLREDASARLAELLENGAAGNKDVRWLADGIADLYKFWE